MLSAEAAALIEDNLERVQFTRDSEAKNVKRSMEILNDILLPHQQQRLAQLTLRLKVEQYGLPILAEEPEIKELGFPAETFKKLEEATNQAQAKKEGIIKKARDEYTAIVQKAERECQEEIRAVMTPTQQQLLDSLLGPPIGQAEQPVAAAEKTGPK
jgi:hypothetical protein